MLIQRNLGCKNVRVGQESGSSVVKSFDGLFPGGILIELLQLNLELSLVDFHYS